MNYLQRGAESFGYPYILTGESISSLPGFAVRTEFAGPSPNPASPAHQPLEGGYCNVVNTESFLHRPKPVRRRLIIRFSFGFTP
jgi:hypothetical protein